MMKGPRVWTEWLPEPVASEARVEELERFKTVVKQFCKDWEANKTKEWPECYDRVLEWYPVVTQYVALERILPLEEVEQLIKICMEIGFGAKDDFAILLRFFDPATILLKKYRKELKSKIEISWKQLYKLCTLISDGHRFIYQGDELLNAFQDTMLEFIRQSVPFLHKGSAVEIYSKFRSTIQHTQGHECYEALAWLAILLPTTELADDGDYWDTWFGEWMDLFESNASSEFWNFWWLDLFANVAKNDTKGHVNWSKYMPRLFVGFFRHFRVPVGTATADMKPGNAYPSHRASLLFKPPGGAGLSNISKFIIYLLRNEHSGDSAILYLEKLVALLEQYYHPSNGGKWTRELWQFLKSMLKHFTQQLAKQGRENEASKGLIISQEVQSRCCECFLKMALRGQYSKDDTLRLTACQAMCDLSYVAPKLVLPHVYSRFQDALDSMTATFTLPASIHALGICIRPLLLSGLLLDNGFGEQDAASEAIAQAMMNVLPGLDANDTTKTGAVLRFYCAVMFSIPTFDSDLARKNGWLELPLDVDLWADELISKLFVLMENLDAPSHRTDQSHRTEKTSSKGTFLMNDHVFFEAFTDLLLMKLPKSVRHRCMRKMANFMITSAVPCVVQECGQLCSSMIEVDPEAAVQFLVMPLIEKILAELPKSQAGVPNRAPLSHALETTLVWNMGHLSASLGSLGEITARYKDMVMDVVDRTLALTSRDIQSAGLVLLTALFSSLVGIYPKLDLTSFEERIMGNGLHCWMSKYPENFSPPIWHRPSPEEIKLANELAGKYFTEGIRGINDIVNSPPPDNDDFKDRLIWSLCKLRGVLAGCKESFVDFKIPEAIYKSSDGSGTIGTPVRFAGDSGVVVGEPGMREMAAEALTKLCSCVEDQDPTVLVLLVEVMEAVLFLGDSAPPDEYLDLPNSQDDNEVLDVFFMEPPTATHLLKVDLKWQKRRPYYRVLCRLWDEFLQRSSDSSYEKWHSTLVPMVDDAALVPESFGHLFGKLVQLSMHTYEGVRHTAEAVVDRGFVRFPCLGRYYTPVYLLSVARCPVPSDLTLSSLAANPGFFEEVLQSLQKCMQSMEVDSINTMGADVEMGVESKLDASVDGAVSVMSMSHHGFRGTFKDKKRLAAMVYAMMGSRQNTSVASQSITNIFMWQFLVRFYSPLQMQSGPMDPVTSEMFSGLLMLGREGVLMNWKYTLLANFLMLAMLPNRDDPMATQILTHFLQATSSKLPALRTVAMVGLYSILRPLQITDVKNPDIIAAVKSYISQDSFGESLVHILAHSHINLQEDDDKGKMAKYLKHLMHDGSFEERLVRNAHVLVDRVGKWPESDSPVSTLDGTFDLPNIRNIEALAAVAPKDFLAALRKPLSTLLDSLQSHDIERGEKSGLAEILGGILASGAPWVVSNGIKAWDVWVKQFTSSTLACVSLEMADAFSTGVRYGIRGLINRAKQQQSSDLSAIHDIFQSLTAPDDASQRQSSGVIKQLLYMNAAVVEIKRVFALKTMPDQLVQIFSNIVRTLPDMMTNNLQSVREHVASLMVVLCGYLLGQRREDLNPEKLQLIEDAQGICDLLVTRFIEGVEEVSSNILTKEDKDTMDEDVSNGDVRTVEKRQTGSTMGVDAKVGMATQFTILGMRDSQSPSLQKTLIKLLPGLFRIQEMSDPNLKPLQLEAATAFAVLKYMSVAPDNVGDVVDILIESSSLHHSHARAAALVYQQVFWFRHCFYLSDEQTQRMQQFVIEKLKDEKLEVQIVASATLSGMLKGMSAEQEEALRSRFMQQLEEFYPKGRRRLKKTSPKQTPSELRQKHACILGIGAFIACHPYDIPKWMPGMLAAAVPAAGEPSPIKNTITKMLGDFRRTHENESHQELRAAFNEDQWEALQGVGSQASYFT